MQETKSLVRLIFAFLMRLIKLIFRTFPLFGRVVRAQLRSFPKLKMMYLRLMSRPENQHVPDVALATSQVSVLKAEIPIPRKRPLTPHAAIIFSDLKGVINQKKTTIDAATFDSASSPKGLL